MMLDTVVPRLLELVPRGHRGLGGGIHATYGQLFCPALYDKTVLCFRHRDKKLIGFHGFVGKSVMVIDLDMIKQMLIKDFDYFIDKPVFDLGNKYLNSVLTQG